MTTIGWYAYGATVFLTSGSFIWVIWTFWRSRQKLWERAQSADRILSAFKIGPDLNGVVREVDNRLWRIEVKGQFYEISRPQKSVQTGTDWQGRAKYEVMPTGPELRVGEDVMVKLVQNDGAEIAFLEDLPPSNREVIEGQIKSQSTIIKIMVAALFVSPVITYFIFLFQDL